MEDATLQVILGRFDKLDEKIDGALKEHSNLRAEVVEIKTKLEPLVTDATFKRRAAYVGHVFTGAVGAGIVLAVRTIWPAHVPPPSILSK